jgi:hypothetical protein
VLGLLAVFLVTLVLWQARAARRVDELEAAIRARGEPLSPQELEAFYVLPKGQEDTTGLWLTALAFLDVSGFKQDARDLPVVGTGPDIPPPGQPWPQRAAAEALLDKYQQALQGLHDAADRGGAARYPVPFQDGHNMSLPHVLSLRSGARLLILEAHVQAHRGDAHATAESIHALNRLGGSLEQEPLLVGLLFRVAIGTISTEFCGQMLPHVRFSDEDLRRLSDDYRAARYDEGYRRALVAERVLGIMAFENPKASRDELPPRGGLTYNEDQALYLELMDAAIAAAQKPFPQAEEESQAILYRLPRGTKTGLNKPRFPRTKLLFPPLTAYL